MGTRGSVGFSRERCNRSQWRPSTPRRRALQRGFASFAAGLLELPAQLRDDALGRIRRSEQHERALERRDREIEVAASLVEHADHPQRAPHVGVVRAEKGRTPARRGGP